MVTRVDITTAACPACGARGPTPFTHTPDVTLVRCGNCGLVYTSPQNSDRVINRYLHDYDLASHFGELSVRKRVLFERRLADLPKPSPGRDRLCDVGCADGQFLALAAERGWQPHGIELNPPAAERARERGANVISGRLEELDALAWNSFDVVTSWDCLEHVPVAHEFAKRVTALARPGGKILLTTLNLRSLVYRVFRSRWALIQEDHFTYWDRRSLCSLFERQGCVVDDVTSFGLGRDFVRVLDRVAALRRLLSPTAGKGRESSEVPKGWDVSAPVLALERGVNLGLAATGLGVDLYARIRRPATAGT